MPWAPAGICLWWIVVGPACRLSAALALWTAHIPPPFLCCRWVGRWAGFSGCRAVFDLDRVHLTVLTITGESREVIVRTPTMAGLAAAVQAAFDGIPPEQQRSDTIIRTRNQHTGQSSLTELAA